MKLKKNIMYLFWQVNHEKIAKIGSFSGGLSTLHIEWYVYFLMLYVLKHWIDTKCLFISYCYCVSSFYNTKNASWERAHY